MPDRARQRRRAELLEDIRHLTAAGLSRAQIAQRLGYTRCAIDKVLARYRLEGLPTYPGGRASVRPGPVRHGTGHAYNRRRCRCQECRAWNAERARRQRASRRARA